MRLGARPPTLAALRIAIVYAIIGIVYIRFSDVVLSAIVGEATLRRYAWLQTAKGWAFIVVTAVLLFFWIRRTFTAVRASAEARRDTERRTQLLVERVRDYAIFTLDQAGNVTSWNRGAQQITDWAEAEVLGRHVSIFYPAAEATADQPARDLAAAMEKGWIDQDEVRRVRQDGTEFWAAAHFTTLRDDAGHPAGFLCVWRDVTEARRARDALQEAHQMLWSIIDASPLPIVTIDARDCITGWNPAAQRLFGWTADEVIGRNCPSVPDSERAGYAEQILKQLGGKPIQGEEVIRRRKDGAMLQLSLWTSPLADASGKIVGAVGIFADLTERKRAEEQVRLLNETLERRVIERTARLEEANEELQAFSYTVSHDLRIPLRSLQQIARDLLEHHGDKLDDEGKADALRIVGAGARMERQIEDLLEYSRVSRSELKTEPVSLVLTVHELLGRLQRDPSFQNAHVVVQEPLGWVMAHRLTLQQVILNVLTNAITFVAPGVTPSVTISSKEKRNGTLRLCIQDNGIGISEADRERVFHIFERLPAAERYPGLGVGLTVARRAVQRMGGTISIEPVPSGGTIFCIDLPRAEQAKK
jgi:PAS domain S-box-containing protein